MKFQQRWLPFPLEYIKIHSSSQIKIALDKKIGFETYILGEILNEREKPFFLAMYYDINLNDFSSERKPEYLLRFDLNRPVFSPPQKSLTLYPEANNQIEMVVKAYVPYSKESFISTQIILNQLSSFLKIKFNQEMTDLVSQIKPLKVFLQDAFDLGVYLNANPGKLLQVLTEITTGKILNILDIYSSIEIQEQAYKNIKKIASKIQKFRFMSETKLQQIVKDLFKFLTQDKIDVEFLERLLISFLDTDKIKSTREITRMKDIIKSSIQQLIKRVIKPSYQMLLKQTSVFVAINASSTIDTSYGSPLTVMELHKDKSTFRLKEVYQSWLPKLDSYGVSVKDLMISPEGEVFLSGSIQCKFSLDAEASLICQPMEYPHAFLLLLSRNYFIESGLNFSDNKPGLPVEVCHLNTQSCILVLDQVGVGVSVSVTESKYISMAVELNNIPSLLITKKSQKNIFNKSKLYELGLNSQKKISVAKHENSNLDSIAGKCCNLISLPKDKNKMMMLFTLENSEYSDIFAIKFDAISKKSIINSDIVLLSKDLSLTDTPNAKLTNTRVRISIPVKDYLQVQVWNLESGFMKKISNSFRVEMESSHAKLFENLALVSSTNNTFLVYLIPRSPMLQASALASLLLWGAGFYFSRKMLALKKKIDSIITQVASTE